MYELNVYVDLYRNIPSYRRAVDDILQGDGKGGDCDSQDHAVSRILAIQTFYMRKKIERDYCCYDLVSDAIDGWDDIGTVYPLPPVGSGMSCTVLFSDLTGEHPVEELMDLLTERIRPLWNIAAQVKPRLGVYLCPGKPGKFGDALSVNVFLSRKVPGDGVYRKI